MKTALTLVLAFISTASFSTTTCSFRFSRDLSVVLVMDNHYAAPVAGKIFWDDMNFCSRTNGNYSCTELGVGSFKVKFKDLAPQSEGSAEFRISKIDSKDDLGNSFESTSDLGKFIKSVKFTSVVQPEPQVHMVLNGLSFEMDCLSDEETQK